MVDPSMWVFKWFITCFLYSFPVEMVHHLWDAFLQLGTRGLVSFALALTIELAPALLELNDLADLSDYLASLKQIE